MIGVSFRDKDQNSYDRFVFGSEVISVIRSVDVFNEEIIEMKYPEEIEVIRNKNFIRVDIPPGFNNEIELTRRDIPSPQNPMSEEDLNSSSWGKLINICADKLYVTLEETQNTNFKKGGYLGVRFTPKENEKPICFNAYIRGYLQALASNSVGLELEIVGLEASPEGRLILRQLCSLINTYRKESVNQVVISDQNPQTNSALQYL
jgi:hypothetical protein